MRRKWLKIAAMDHSAALPFLRLRVAISGELMSMREQYFSRGLLPIVSDQVPWSEVGGVEQECTKHTSDATTPEKSKKYMETGTFREAGTFRQLNS